MKFTHKSVVFGILFCLFSCSKDNYEPFQPTEWQYEKYSNSHVLPGDDFYRFVCGKGIETQGSDSWAPFSRWNKQNDDFAEQSLRDDNQNPVPILRRLNELRTQASSHITEATTRMRERLNDIDERTKDMDFPEKVAEYYKSGYNFFITRTTLLYGHSFGISTIAMYEGMMQEWTTEQLMLAGIKEKYEELLPKARIFEKYLLDNIKTGGESVQDLNAEDSEQCRWLKDYVESFVSTKANNSAFERFATALGNKNPIFVPINDETRQYFELIDKMDVEMKKNADAFLWCVAVSSDLDLIFKANDHPNFIPKFPDRR